MKIIIPQIIGLLAVTTFLLSYQQKKRKNIILFNVISRCLYILQYVLLGAFAGAILDILGAVSSVIAGKKHTEFIKKHTVLVLMLINVCIVIIGSAIAIINQSWIDLFSIAGVLLHTSAFWISREKTIRLVSLLGSPFWFIYNFLSQAYGSAIGDILTMCSIIIAMIRYKNAEKSSKEG
ncbi:MAG: YgjV family protein [Ruminococcaceae bacterium]|nr:YgjV family protein [Oscillospiraceae bacterium]